MEENAKQMMNAIRVFLAVMGALVMTFFVINIVQGNQTGRGLGINDTRIEPDDQARLYRDEHAPRN